MKMQVGIVKIQFLWLYKVWRLSANKKKLFGF